MRVVFRVDASLLIGTGHVMRCLTLADELTRHGHECWFICREHPGHLGDLIASQGYSLTLLPAPTDLDMQQNTNSNDDYARWLGVQLLDDARQTFEAISPLKPDWLVVDHYALDAQWERMLKSAVFKIMVIDDLANRSHECTVLLDQTFGRNATEYQPWVPHNCQLLCGSQYALLRSEFAELRPYSLQRRSKAKLRKVLVTMGGVDRSNVTGRVLDRLRESELPPDCRVVVVMGATAPWLEEIKLKAKILPWFTEVKVGVSNMAHIMADSDLAIGAAGATTWERCCLGLPSIQIVVAENQKTIASNLQKAGAAICLPRYFDAAQLNNALRNMDIEEISYKSSLICSGIGVNYVSEKLVEI